jgi:hypothetical protein
MLQSIQDMGELANLHYRQPMEIGMSEVQY